MFKIRGKIINPEPFNKNRKLFSYILQFKTLSLSLIKKEHTKIVLHIFVFILFFMIPVYIEILILKNAINALLLITIYLFFLYKRRKVGKAMSHYKNISILSDETVISFQEDCFCLSTEIRTMEIPYNDPYLKIRLLYSQLCFTCFWGKFSFSKSDLLEGNWNDLIKFIERKSYLLK